LRRFDLVWRTLVRLGLLVAAITLFFAARAPSARAADAPTEAPAEAVLELVVNGQQPGIMLVVLADAAGSLWIDERDFASLRLKPPAGEALERQGLRYLPVAAIAGSHVELDAAAQRARVDVPATAFEATRLSAGRRVVQAPTAASPGAFLNYQLSAQRVGGEGISGGLAELGLFARPGVLTNSMVARRIAGESVAVRLDTTFTHDFNSRIERLQLGDAISDSGSWGSSARFGGISWGRNFSLRPDLLTTPLLSTTGSALVPSTVDVYVNNQRVSSQQLPPGPFIIDQLPTVTGSGQVSVVVRDALGREQQVTRPFYSSLQQLAPGLDQYRVDIGKLRLDYTLASAHYGALLASGTYRRGFTDRLTGEVHGEYLDHGAHSAGIALATALGHWALLNVNVAGGGDAGSSGVLYGIGFERRGERMTLLGQHSHASDGYRQVSSSIGNTAQYHDRDLLQVGVAAGRAGSGSLAWVRQASTGLPTQQTFSASWSRSLGGAGSLNLSATRFTQGPLRGTSVFLTWTWALDARNALLATGSGGSGTGAPANELYGTWLHNAPLGPGRGWRIGASSAGNYDLDWREQTPVGDLEGQAARNNEVAGTSAFWSGAATWLGGQFNATRSLNDSFALVDLDGLADVPVYLDNQLVAHTDRHGRALLYNLRPYEANRIGIDPVELPLDTAISSRLLTLAPAYRSGVVARFPVERVAGATFRLVQEDGTPVPAGAIARFKGADFPVTLDGMTYVTGFDHGFAGDARWQGGRCAFRLEPPPPGDPLPDMGSVHCLAPRDRAPSP
jgi:outer membrane usher protein